MEPDKLIPLHGGYRKLKSFQVAQLAYDVTVRFPSPGGEGQDEGEHEPIIPSPGLRPPSPIRWARDMQAARSGVQNIAEGSQASGTSKKMELKLTNVARASLEELRLDFEDFLRQRSLAQWPPEHPALITLRRDGAPRWQKCGLGWKRNVVDKHGLTPTDKDGEKLGSCPCLCR